MAHKINVIDAPAGATLDIEMLNQPYPFGAKFSWEMFEDADGNNSTWTDLQAGVIGRRPTIISKLSSDPFAREIKFKSGIRGNIFSIMDILPMQ